VNLVSAFQVIFSSPRLQSLSWGFDLQPGSQLAQVGGGSRIESLWPGWRKDALYRWESLGGSSLNARGHTASEDFSFSFLFLPATQLCYLALALAQVYLFYLYATWPEQNRVLLVGHLHAVSKISSRSDRSVVNSLRCSRPSSDLGESTCQGSFSPLLYVHSSLSAILPIL